MSTGTKQPLSVLVVIHTPQLDVLLLERADYPRAWQSVTGSREGQEALSDTAYREVDEETGLDSRRYPLTDWQQVNRYEIYPRWRHRYPAGVTHNEEHVFSLCVPDRLVVTLAPQEHLAAVWLRYDRAAGQVFSPSNAEALRQLPRHYPAL